MGLRLAAAGWWRVVAESPPAVWPTVASVVGLALVPGALTRLADRRGGWPTAALLLVTSAIMHVVGRVLVFGFRDLGLGLAWSVVHAAVVLAILGIAVRGRHGRAAIWRLGAMAIAAAAFTLEIATAVF